MVTIHMCDDDPDDRLLIKEALQEAKVPNEIDYTEDGEQLLRYLRREGEFENLKDQPMPGLILLDLNMPKKDGRETLIEIKKDNKLKHIPVVILTTSRADEDILKSYEMGVNSFISKPVTFGNLVVAVKAVTDYWFNVVELPKS